MTISEGAVLDRPAQWETVLDVPAAPGAPDVPDVERTAAPPRVLVVESDPVLAESLALAFEASGFVVHSAENGLDALYDLERTIPDLVVTDLNVPIISGFRLVTLLKRDATTRSVPVMVLSPVSFQEARDAIRSGADDFLPTSIAPTEVVARASHLLERAQPMAQITR